MKFLYRWMALILLFPSCQKDPQIIDNGRKIVVNSLITTDSLIGVNISGSMFISDSSKFVEGNFITDASIGVYENDNYLDLLNYSKIFSFLGDFYLVPNNYRSKSFMPKPGNQYKIVINAPDKPEATAITTIPNMVKIEKTDTSRIILPIVEGWQSNIKMVCNITFTDPANEKNFYLLYVFYSVDKRMANLIYDGVSFLDPIVEEKISHGGETFGIAFTDKSINGKKHSLPLTLDGTVLGFPPGNPSYKDPFPEKKVVVYFRLYSITEEYFKYIQSLNLFFKNYKNPLTEPTQVYSNVNGGYGIFAGAAVSCDSLVFNH